MKKILQNRFVTPAIMLVFAVFLIVAVALSHAHPAHASFLDTLKNIFLGTQQVQPATGTQQTAAVPLYKPVIDYEKAVVDAVKKASPAVVSITVSKNVPIIEECPVNPFGDLPPDLQQFFGGNVPQFSAPCQKGTQFQEVGGGSGFIISADGLILTNKHVVADTQASYTVFTNDGKKYTAKVLARDPAQDLAVVKIDAQNLPTVDLGDSDSLELGQSAIAIGNALGEYRNTVSVGVISGLSRTVTASGDIGTETIQGVLQTDAAINPGNSGGPLLNLEGQVVGINTAIAADAQNVGFAIPINKAKHDIESVKANGTIEAAYMGVRYVSVTPDLASQDKLPVDYGALVKGDSGNPAVAPGSPAATAGIKAGDVILSVDGKQIDSTHTLGDYVAQLNVGETVDLQVQRDAQVMDIKVTLAKRPQ